MTKIEIKNLSILFGPEKMRAKRMLVAGKSKQNILKETGCTVAVRNANLKIEEGEFGRSLYQRKKHNDFLG